MHHLTCLYAFLLIAAPSGAQAAPAPKTKPTAVIDVRTDQHVKWVQERLVSCAHIAILRDKKVAELAIVRRHLHDPKDTKELISWLEKNFRIDCLPKTKIIRVTLREGTPEEQAAIINLVVNDFLKEQVDSRRDSLTQSLKSAKDRVDELRRTGRLTQKEAAEAEMSFKKHEEYIKTLPVLVESAKAR